MIDKYQRFHASCVRSEKIPSGPGELIVSLPGPVRLVTRHPGSEQPTEVHYEDGVILHADVYLPSVRDAVALHLTGSALQSEIRFGVGLLLGLQPATRDMVLSSDQERLIDDWLDAHAVFIFRLLGPDDGYLPQPPPAGLFNGVMRDRQIHWGTAFARH